MASGRCPSCGGELPRGASFCPRCGVGVDDVPVLGLIGDDPPAADEVDAPRSNVARTVVVLVAGIVAVVVVLASVSGGDGGTTEEAEPTTSTSPATSTSGSPTTSSTTAPLLVGEPGGSAASGALLVQIVADDLAVIDLATGRQIVVPGPDDDIQEVAVDAGHLVTTTSRGTLYVLRLDGTSEWREVESFEAGGLSGFPGGDILIGFDGTIGAIGTDGELSLWEIPGAAGGGFGAVGRLGDDMVLSTFDGVYLLGPDGGARRVARGQALATNGSAILVLTCDDRLRCTPVLVDADGVEIDRFPALPGDIAIQSATISPDGRDAVLGGWNANLIDSASGSQILRLDGDEWLTVEQRSTWALARGAWLDDTGTVAWWSPDSAGVEVVSADGESSTITIRSTSSSFSSGVVVSEDDLPPAWLDELRG